VNTTKGKSEAYKQAIRLGRQIGARLTIVDVVLDLPSFVTSLMGDSTAFRKQQHTERLRILKQWSADEDVPVSAKVLHGRIAHSLILEVLEGQHDLLVRDAHADDGAELIFGGVDLRLMRNCPCPVWLVKAGHHGNYNRVLAAIECQPTPEAEVVNARIVEMASSLANTHESDFHIVSAWQGLEDFDPDLGDWEQLSDKMIEVGARHSVQQTIEQSKKISDYQTHFRRGAAGEIIPQVAAEIDADLIVMGTLARTGIPGLLIGNTAERVLKEVDCSVLTIKPLEFVSPIRPIEDDKVRV